MASVASNAKDGQEHRLESLANIDESPDSDDFLPLAPRQDPEAAPESTTDGSSSCAGDCGSGGVDPCAICFESITEMAITVPCNHTFDFECIHTWFESFSSTCPLCKTKVTTVRHHFNASQTDWETYTVNTDKKGQWPDTTPLDLDSLPPDHPARQIASFDFSPPPIPDIVVRRHRIRQARARRYRAESSSAAPGIYAATAAEAAAMERRQTVYREGLYSYHMGANRHSRYYGTLTPLMFQNDPDLVSRARAFLRRELQAVWRPPGLQALALADSAFDPHPPPAQRATARPFTAFPPQRLRDSEPGEPMCPRNLEIITEYIICVLKHVDLQDSSGAAQQILEDFMSTEDAQLFLHEMRSYLRSPYQSLHRWDQEVQYGISEAQRRRQREQINSQNAATGTRKSGAGTLLLRATLSREHDKRHPASPASQQRYAGPPGDRRRPYVCADLYDCLPSNDDDFSELAYEDALAGEA